MRDDGRGAAAIANAIFTTTGAATSADRAARELLATDQATHRTSTQDSALHNAQEAQIANLARAGRSNHEIGRRRFISARTVKWHLAKVPLHGAGADEQAQPISGFDSPARARGDLRLLPVQCLPGVLEPCDRLTGGEQLRARSANVPAPIA